MTRALDGICSGGSIISVSAHGLVMDQWEKYNYTVSATNTVVLLLCSGLAVAFVCGVATCTASANCERARQCSSSSESFCGFSSTVGIVTDAQYGMTVTADSLSTLLRGLCSPGDRTQQNPQSGVVECVPYFPFPSGINAEIVDSSKSTPAEQACGRWIDASGPSIFINQVTRRGRYDNEQWVQELLNAEDYATKGSRTASTGMAKFRAECERTALAGPAALRTAATMSYEYFRNYIETNAVDRRGFLRSIGFEMSHRCAATTYAASYLQGTGEYKLYLSSGYRFYSSTLSSALQVFDESVQLQQDADDANRAITDYYYYDALTNITLQDLYDVLEGATGMNNLTMSLPLDTTSLLKAALNYYDSNPSKAIAYLKGIAALCSYNAYSTFSDTSDPYRNNLELELSRIKSMSPKATRLGRLENIDEEPDIFHDAINATGMTLSNVLGSTGTGDPVADCLGVMRVVFADEIEAARFDATIPRYFYTRLQSLVLSIRVGIGIAANTEPIRGILNNVTEFVHRVSNAGVKIVGAPRGSWAGLARSVPRAELSSSDGMFIMILKQARSSFFDEVVQAGIVGGVDPCDHAPFSSQTTWNAYMLRDLDCSKYFLGLAHRPMLDPQYDDATIVSRGLHVVAHELAHIAQSVGWDHTNLSNFLYRYHPDTYTEAIADTIAAVGVISSGFVSRADFIQLFCQTWCARQPFGWTHPSTNPITVHPSGNMRCDYLAQTLDEFYPELGE